MAAETVWRNKALAADVNTPLNSAPFNGASNARMSEFQASGRQSRISMLVEGKLPSVKIGGYYEADFLSAGTTSKAGCASITSGQGAFNSSETGGGGGANARWSLFNKHMDLGVHFLGGNGIGRYGSVGLASTTVRPNGTIVPITSYQSLGTVQFHPTPKLDINLYVGGEYDERTAFAKSGTTNNEGYGAQAFNNSGCWTEVPSLTGPSTSTNLGVPDGVGGSTGFIPGPLGGCRGDTRNLIEGTIQFWYRFYKGPKGTVQYGMQFSDYVRNTWYGTGGSGPAASGQPHSNEAMWFTSFRYYLP